ncbi:hypothetical protein [Dictyobacter arantiisoli]|uniref:Uncharacterized protein n=1 Tax=Dictyobacter arantiisoli TaxID=2014874 RepID=A0A5A5TES2_9CHLR|nr:hypothetical protein [Dictyobacter arantiisoli]GCF09725.1 hypothetical protein KDI_32890 [Dictyobacter arantiisoli]
MRTRLFSVSCIVGAVFFGLFILVQPNVQAEKTDIIIPKPLNLSQMKASSLPDHPGHPAIDPVSSATEINTVHSNVEVSIRVKSDNVKTYLLSHEFPCGPLVAGAILKVVSIDLLSSKDASARLSGESLGLPDTAPVYLVKVQGPFKTTMMPFAPGAKAISQVPYGIEVFDAETGNMLIWSIPIYGN